MRTVLTYGTYDLFHFGHLEILRRARELGDKLIVGVSTDEFNSVKGKSCVYSFRERESIVAAIKYVDQVIAERDWEQKADDILRYSVDVFVMGDDWLGKFDQLKSICDVVYLPRTDGISTTLVKETVRLGPSNRAG